MSNIAEVCFSMGRSYLKVGGVIVAVEGDKCREILPVEAADPIPEEELAQATIGGKPAKDMPPHLIQFFRGECWREKSLEWAAKRINAVAAGEAEPYSQDEAIPKKERK